jgi:hypothetical protein
MKHYLLTFNEDWADEHNVPALAVMDESEYKNWCESKHEIYAYLGNGGEGFMEDNQDLQGKELVKQKIVNVFEVDEAFIKQFKKANLGYLSLCNVFNNINDDGYDEEDENADVE